MKWMEKHTPVVGSVQITNTDSETQTDSHRKEVVCFEHRKDLIFVCGKTPEDLPQKAKGSGRILNVPPPPKSLEDYLA